MKEKIKKLFDINMKDVLGMFTYFGVSALFGGGYGAVILALHEDNDRCHYYNGEWNKEDLIRGGISIAIGSLIHYLATNDVCFV